MEFINHQSVLNQVGSYVRFHNYKRINSVIYYLAPHEQYQKMKKAAQISYNFFGALQLTKEKPRKIINDNKN